MKLNIQLFASGTITGTSTCSIGRIQILWNSVAGDSVANSSEVTATVQVKRSNAYETTGTFSGSVSINGSSKSISKKFSPLSNSWKTVGTYTLTVPHNADGTKTCNIQTTLTQTGTSMAGTYTANADVQLDTILRESTPTLSSSSVDMGSSVTIYTNRQSSSFTHTIRYAFGGDSGTIATNVGDNTSWTPSINLANQIPNSTSGTGVIYCDTYSGGTLIGTKSVNITLNVPSAVIPSVSIGTLSEANATMISLNWGIYVQSKSQLSIPITASGSYSSTISGITSTTNGGSYNGASVTTTTLGTSGTNTITTTATDSRGRQNSTSTTYSVVAYSNPSITTAECIRVNSSNVADDDGTYLSYKFVGSISSVSNHNSATFRIGYRVKDSNTAFTYKTISTSYTVNVTSFTRITDWTIANTSAYEVVFEAIDTFNTSSNPIRKSTIIPTGFDLMNFNPSGKAMAIGKVSAATGNNKLLEVAMDTKIDGNTTINGNETINGSVTANGQLSVQANTYSGIVVTAGNSYDECSVRYYGKDNGNTVGYVAGVNVGGIGDGWGVYRDNVGTVIKTDSSGNFTTTGYVRAGGGVSCGGDIWMDGHDLIINTWNSSSNDSGDIVFKYGNGNEKCRLWTNDNYTSFTGLNYREYNESGNWLGEGRLAVSGKVLYEDADGTNGTVYLNDGVQYFKYIEIYFRQNQWRYNSTKIYDAHGKTVSLIGLGSIGSGSTWLQGALVYCEGGEIRRDASFEFKMASSPSYSTSNNIYITKVVGYRN